jgi:hypothetical protein
MRWHLKPSPPDPRPGDKRTITKFAWLPIWINLEIRWLEWVAIEQRYSIWPGWENRRFLN